MYAPRNLMFHPCKIKKVYVQTCLHAYTKTIYLCVYTHVNI